MDATSPPDIYLFDDFRLDQRGGGLFRCAEVGRSRSGQPRLARARRAPCSDRAARRSRGEGRTDGRRLAEYGGRGSQSHGADIDAPPRARQWPAGSKLHPDRTRAGLPLRRGGNPAGSSGRCRGFPCIRRHRRAGAHRTEAESRNRQRRTACCACRVAWFGRGPPAGGTGDRRLGVATRHRCGMVADRRPVPTGRPNARRPRTVRFRFPAAAAHPSAPRLSLVVLPFKNLGGDPKDDYLADGITDDLTSDLAHISGRIRHRARIRLHLQGASPRMCDRSARNSACATCSRAACAGSGSTLRVNAQLMSAETGAHLWSDRFDEEISELAAGQEQIVTRMRAGLGISMVEIEKARSLRERPTNPDAFDLILRARSLQNLPPNLQRNEEALALYEHALALDPTSAYATRMSGYSPDQQELPKLGDRREHAACRDDWLAQARAIAPDAEGLLDLTDSMATARSGETRKQWRLPRSSSGDFPTTPAVIAVLYDEQESYAGHAEEAIHCRRKRSSSTRAVPICSIAIANWASLRCCWGRDKDAITFLERSLAINPDDDGGRQWIYRFLAAAYAQAGELAAAKRCGRRSGPALALRHRSQSLAGRAVEPPFMPSRSGVFRPGCVSRASATTPMKTRISACRLMPRCTANLRALRRRPHLGRARSAPLIWSSFLRRPDRSSSTPSRIHGAGRSPVRSG